MYTLENNQLRIQVTSMGAELKSIYSKIKQKEYLWQADPRWWGRSAPHLFPRIGFETNEYIQENKIVKHGYARDTEFVLIEKTATTLKFMMKEELIVSYELAENNLSISYEVTADFPFMIGGHPAFNINSFPINLEFKNKCSYYQLKNNLIDNTKEIGIDLQNINIDEYTFLNDVLIFDNAKNCNQARLGRELVITFNSEYFGVWAPPGAPFVCLEPWWIMCKNRDTKFKYSLLVL